MCHFPFVRFLPKMAAVSGHPTAIVDLTDPSRTMVSLLALLGTYRKQR